MNKPNLHGFIPPAHVPIMIVAAACTPHGVEDGPIFVSARHFSPAMHSQLALAYPDGDYPRMDQEFIDQWDRFWPREAAFYIIKETGQVLDNWDNLERGALYSENLY